MRAIIKQKKEYVLVLNEEEGNWLKSYLQNTRIEKEGSLDQKMRKLFWNLLDKGGEKQMRFIRNDM